YRRCHGEGIWMIVQGLEVGAGTLCTEACLVHDEYVARAWPRYTNGWVAPVPGVAVPRSPEAEDGPRNQGQSRPPKTPRVPPMNMGTSIRAPGRTKIRQTPKSSDVSDEGHSLR